eukprot:11163242-Lingulodinium_polyedra.AAC.1
MIIGQSVKLLVETTDEKDMVDSFRDALRPCDISPPPWRRLESCWGARDSPAFADLRFPF